MKSIASNLRMHDNRRDSAPYISTKWNQARRARVRKQWEQWQQWKCRGSQQELDRATLGPWYEWAVAMMAEDRHAARVAKAQAALRYHARNTHVTE